MSKSFKKKIVKLNCNETLTVSDSQTGNLSGSIPHVALRKVHRFSQPRDMDPWDSPKMVAVAAAHARRQLGL